MEAIVFAIIILVSTVVMLKLRSISGRQSKSETDLEDLEKLLEGLKKKMITSLVLD